MTATPASWSPSLGALRRVRAGVLEVGVHESGPTDGPVVVLSHGFPFSVEAYAEVAPRLADAGCRVVVPHLRGYGETRFLDAATPRSGEQAALGADLVALLDALAVPRAVLAGFDWGGRASCVAAAPWPSRCSGLVTLNGYNVQDPALAQTPTSPEAERRYWYQYFMHGPRGRTALEDPPWRDDFCRHLWTLWSPTWPFDDAAFARSAAAFANADFVDVVLHSYRHRHGLVAGDPACAALEDRLAARPTIAAPTIAVDGADDGVTPVGAVAATADRFVGEFEVRVVADAGHALPHEQPGAFATAVLDLVARERAQPARAGP